MFQASSETKSKLSVRVHHSFNQILCLFRDLNENQNLERKLKQIIEPKETYQAPVVSFPARPQPIFDIIKHLIFVFNLVGVYSGQAKEWGPVKERDEVLTECKGIFREPTHLLGDHSQDSRHLRYAKQQFQGLKVVISERTAFRPKISSKPGKMNYPCKEEFPRFRINQSQIWLLLRTQNRPIWQLRQVLCWITRDFQAKFR